MHNEKNNENSKLGENKKRFFKNFIDREKMKKRLGLICLGKGNMKQDGERAHSLVKYKNENVGVEDGDIPIIIPSADKVKTKKRTDGETFFRCICLFLTVLSLVSVVAVALITLIYSIDPPMTEPSGTEGILQDSGSNDKVIFIKDPDYVNGFLTMPEIYEKGKASVVTVISNYGKAGESLGSGFVFSSDGYIATAYHIVENCDNIRVMTCDNKKFSATLVCGDSLSDVALLKINAKDLIPIEFGKSEGLLVGERIYAIGTPSSVEYAGTFSAGEITYADRVVEIYGSDGKLQKKYTAIQTNMDLDYGNSGCPIFNGFGEVIGMVSMRVGNTDMAFALPSDGVGEILRAMKYGDSVDEMVAAGVVTLAPRLGVGGEVASVNGILGWRIVEFSQCGSTAPTFLRIGDVITHVNAVPVCRESDISGIINEYAPGDTVSVTVIRSGQSLIFDVILGS